MTPWLHPFPGVVVLMHVINPFRTIGFNYKDQFSLTYGGLRGAISFALVFLLPQTIVWRRLFLTATVTMIIFTVFIQVTPPWVGCQSIAGSHFRGSSSPNWTQSRNIGTLHTEEAGTENATMLWGHCISLEYNSSTLLVPTGKCCLVLLLIKHTDTYTGESKPAPWRLRALLIGRIVASTCQPWDSNQCRSDHWHGVQSHCAMPPKHHTTLRRSVGLDLPSGSCLMLNTQQQWLSCRIIGCSHLAFYLWPETGNQHPALDSIHKCEENQLETGNYQCWDSCAGKRPICRLLCLVCPDSVCTITDTQSTFWFTSGGPKISILYVHAGNGAHRCWNWGHLCSVESPLLERQVIAWLVIAFWWFTPVSLNTGTEH